MNGRSETESFLDNLYGEPVKRKKLNAKTVRPSESAPTHPILKPIGSESSLELALVSLGVKPGSQLDRIVALDNFAAGRAKRGERQRTDCPRAARFPEISDQAVVARLHELWLEYAGQDRPELVGAKVKVVESGNAGNVGISGVVLKDGLNALSVFCDKKRKTLLLPRDVCRFHVIAKDKIWILDDRKI